MSDTITDEEGNEISLSPPVAEELPESGFETTLEGFIQPDDGEVEIIIDPESNRLQALVPFSPFESDNYHSMTVLMKASGKCTTDHISPAGKW